jgi:transposase
MMRAGAERLTDQQWARFEKAIAADGPHLEVYVAWLCAPKLRPAHRHPNTVEGRKIAEQILESCPTCRSPRSRGSDGH